MKIRLSAIFALLLAIVFGYISCDNPFSREWAAKIGNDVISIKDFNRFYYTQNKILFSVETNEEIDKLAMDPSGQMNQYLNKQSFLEALINQKVVFDAAMDDKSIDQDELKTIIELGKYTTVIQYYIMKKLKNKITVTEEEVEQFYNKNKDKLSKYTANEAVALCRRNLEQNKLQMETMRFIEELKQKAGVNRDGFKDYMSKAGK